MLDRYSQSHKFDPNTTTATSVLDVAKQSVDSIQVVDRVSLQEANTPGRYETFLDGVFFASLTLSIYLKKWDNTEIAGKHHSEVLTKYVSSFRNEVLLTLSIENELSLEIAKGLPGKLELIGREYLNKSFQLQTTAVEKIIKSVNLIQGLSRDFAETDRLIFRHENFPQIEIGKASTDFKLEIEDIAADSISEEEFIETIVIKKPDLTGDPKWKIIFQGKNKDAVITDSEFMRKFNAREVYLFRGMTAKAEGKIIKYTDKHGKDFKALIYINKLTTPGIERQTA